MQSLNIELFLGKFSFIILFFNMLFYWIQSSFIFDPLSLSINSFSNQQNQYVNTEEQNETNNFSSLINGVPREHNCDKVTNGFLKERQLFSDQNCETNGLLSKATSCDKVTNKNTRIDDYFQPKNNFELKNVSKNLNKQSNFKNIGIFITSLANFSIMLLLIIRWVEYGHFPLSNLYESLIFLSWSFTLINIILEKTNNTISVGAIISPITLLTNAFATFSLPQSMQKATALVPALQSNWLMMHVTVMLLSYAALFIGCLLSIAFLILTSKTLLNNNFLRIIETKYFFNIKKTNLNYSSAKLNQIDFNLNTNFYSSSLNQGFDGQPRPSRGFDSLSLPEHTSCVQKVKSENENLETNFLTFRVSAAKTLDNLSYRVLGIGFPLLTIGILSGAIWANEAWGSYWSWDPKETWALITWLVFAIYLHVRITKGWNGKKPAIIATCGFFVVWVCFLGVNLLGKGLHSYGWLS